MVTCEICSVNPGIRTCPSCGRRVCEMHRTGRGLCTICEQALCRICGRNLSVTHCLICGRLGCNECLIQVDNVRRVCRDCLRAYPSWRSRLREVLYRYTSGARVLALRVPASID